MFKKFGAIITTVLARQWFFYVVLGFFVFQALWFVFSAQYPMAFDEEFHFGIAQIYTQHWLPHIAEHPEGANVFGAVARDVSFFFHYLMSFPLRFVELFTASEAVQVIVLRTLNVGMFALSLVLFRKVLLRAGTSPALTHTAMAIFVLIPIVPQLAAHINYDNLLMVLLAWAILAVMNLTESFKARRVDVQALILLVILSAFMVITKYAALPLVLAMVLFAAAMGLWKFRGHFKKLWPALASGYRKINTLAKVALLVALVAGLGMFAERYGGNMVMYQEPIAACDSVLTVEQCREYGPWGRNYNYRQNANPDFQASPVTYMGEWLSGMHHRLFFAINGVHDRYTNYLQLPVPSKTAVVIAVAGGVATLIWFRETFRRRPYFTLFLLLIVVYVGILWYRLYSGYSITGVAAAVNGRYLLPILLPMAAIMGTALAIGLRKLRLASLKPYLATAAIVLFLHGGGVFTFILRSDEAWYWDNRAVHEVNNTARSLLSPVTIEGRKW